MNITESKHNQLTKEKETKKTIDCFEALKNYWEEKEGKNEECPLELLYKTAAACLQVQTIQLIYISDTSAKNAPTFLSKVESQLFGSKVGSNFSQNFYLELVSNRALLSSDRFALLSAVLIFGKRCSTCVK